jgi:hypothetical protein
MTFDRKLLLPEAPNFSTYLKENFEGVVSVSDIKEVRQGFSSDKNSLLSFLFGKGPISYRIDEDRFYELQEQFSGYKDYFVRPFYKCLRTTISFLPPEKEIASLKEILRNENLSETGEDEWKRNEESVDHVMNDFLDRLKGTFRIYPEFKNIKTGEVPITYQGFRPGEKYNDITTVDDIHLIYGSYSSLVKLIDYFDALWAIEIRGPLWKSGEYKRYDAYNDIPFP